MPKAEVGSTKYLANKMKAKGLQRLRFYCQVCERQMRDENGFKQHTLSEGHVRQMLLVGEDPKKYIADFSRQFQRDFLQLLRTGHGEKQVHINHFYQEYIANKEHVHMNSTKWPSLTDFAKHLGREGICRVEETERGIHIAWIDDSPEALRRKDALKRKELQDRGDEEREQRMIREQIRRAKRAAAGSHEEDDEEDAEDTEARALNRGEGDRIKLSFGAKPAARSGSVQEGQAVGGPGPEPGAAADASLDSRESAGEAAEKPPPALVSLKMTPKGQPKNVFAVAKKNALAGGLSKPTFQQPQKMSEAERIMREEMERANKKRPAPWGSAFSFKKQKQ